MLNIIGLGAVAIHMCGSQEEASATTETYKAVTSLVARAILYVRAANESVEISGSLTLINGDSIPLYTGGALDNPAESIYASLAIVDNVYVASDFALR
ncbi:hypothetical protein [Thalassolituus marinus]|uniref:BON domain-containing protein n=1 Tax=Thalassolituus marinus TaxID=671053 RepID=A0ABS7ZUS9_9GAMM|nr:hypothetical protein [Thalassolituus marinus]MCA6065436.1 hypothetical protein [Thalassolituus marinus]